MVLRRKLPSQLEEKIKASEQEGEKSTLTPASAPASAATANKPAATAPQEKGKPATSEKKEADSPSSKMQKRLPKEAEPEESAVAEQPAQVAEAREANKPAPQPELFMPPKTADEAAVKAEPKPKNNQPEQKNSAQENLGVKAEPTPEQKPEPTVELKLEQKPEEKIAEKPAPITAEPPKPREENSELSKATEPTAAELAKPMPNNPLPPPELIGGEELEDVLKGADELEGENSQPQKEKNQEPVVAQPARPPKKHKPEEVQAEQPAPSSAAPVSTSPAVPDMAAPVAAPKPAAAVVEAAPAATSVPATPAPQSPAEPEPQKSNLQASGRKTISFDDEGEESPVLPWVAAAQTSAKAVPAAQTPPQPAQADSTKPAGNMPPWVAAQTSGSPPTLPEDKNSQEPSAPPPQRDQYNMLTNVMLVVVVGSVLFGTYILFFREQEKTTEMLARWTGTLSEVSQEVPTEIQEEGMVSATLEGDLSSSEGALLAAPEQMEDSVATATPLPLEELPDVSEVPAEEAKIVIQDPKPAPKKEQPSKEDLSLFASLQSAIQEAKKEKEGTAGEAEKLATKQNPADKLVAGQASGAELEEELAAYRQQLSSSSRDQVLPKPGAFFKEYGGVAQKNAAQVAPTSLEKLPSLDPVPAGKLVAEPLAPPAAASEGQGGGAASAASQQAVYNPNPRGLPIVGEPKVVNKPSVRYLDDFDATMFAPKEPSVRIPKNLRPSMNSNTFPALELLSLVPNRGIIALKDNQEGVLMIGETVEGWELIAVYDEYAEFQKNSFRHIMTRN